MSGAAKVNSLFLNYKFDGDMTEKNVEIELDRVKRPMSYKELYASCAAHTTELFSVNTKPVEKFRQYFSDNQRKNVVFIEGGYLGLKSWFPTNQRSLLPAQPYSEIINGSCDVAWEAGYEIARREPFLYDHFNDRFTTRRRDRRKRGSLVEFHVRQFFKENYPNFYVEPSNHMKYDCAAVDDFKLRFPISNNNVVTILIDIKSFSENESKDGIIRNPKDGVVYMFADIVKDDKIVMYGFGKGDYLKEIGVKEGALVKVTNNYLMPMDKIIVMLNIANVGMDYKSILSSIKSTNY